MRSFSPRRASETNKSGGIHGMSRWQSAEILRYCMLFSPLQVVEGCPEHCTPSKPRIRGKGAYQTCLFCARGMNTMQPAACVRTQRMLYVYFSQPKVVKNALYHFRGSRRAVSAAGDNVRSDGTANRVRRECGPRTFRFD